MKITVLFFGVAQEIAGVRQMPLELMEGATAIDLRGALANRFSGLDEGLAYALAVNEKLCTESQVLCDGDVAAVLPPVSGG
jgi:hypothetical protein